MSVVVNQIGDIRRAGVKGPNTAEWLTAQGVAIPSSVNSWAVCEGGRVLRLGRSEFLIEGATVCSMIESASQPIAPGIYKVPRADACFTVGGEAALDLLSELCLLDLRENTMPADAVLMTQLGGISATLIRESQEGKPLYRIWCDGTYSEFMREILQEITQELGGTAHI